LQIQVGDREYLTTQIQAAQRGKDILKEWHADLILFGKVVADSSLYIWTINEHGGCDSSARPVVLTHGLLPGEFEVETKTKLFGAVLREIAAACNHGDDMNWDLFKRQMRKLTALMWASRLDLPEEEQLNLSTSYYNGLNLLYHHDGDEGWFQAASSFANFEVTIGRTDLQKANAWYFYGRALISKGLKTNDSEAFNLSIKVLDQFLRVAPASDAEWRADALVMRSDAYKLKGDTGLAIQDLGEAIRLLPVSEKGKAVKALVARSALHTFKGDDVLAIEDLDEALRLTPNDPDILNSRCYKLAKVGRLELALVDCNKSLDLRPNHAATLDSRGFTYLKMKRVESAINDYDAVLRLDPKSAYSLYGRGVAYLTLGNEDQGNQDIAAAKAIKADIADELARYGVK
jgi:tetratricopeptide (TPR) repeat protein